MLEKVWRKGSLLHSWRECKLVQPLWRTVWRFLKKLKLELPYDPAIPLPGKYLEKTTTQEDSLVAQRLKHLPGMQETRVQSLGREDPLEKEIATHSSILAWRISWTEELGGLQSTGSQRVRHD